MQPMGIQIYSNHGTIPMDYTIVPKLIDGAISIERGELDKLLDMTLKAMAESEDTINAEMAAEKHEY